MRPENHMNREGSTKPEAKLADIVGPIFLSLLLAVITLGVAVAILVIVVSSPSSSATIPVSFKNFEASHYCPGCFGRVGKLQSFRTDGLDGGAEYATYVCHGGCKFRILRDGRVLEYTRTGELSDTWIQLEEEDNAECE